MSAHEFATFGSLLCVCLPVSLCICYRTCMPFCLFACRCVCIHVSHIVCYVLLCLLLVVPFVWQAINGKESASFGDLPLSGQGGQTALNAPAAVNPIPSHPPVSHPLPPLITPHVQDPDTRDR